MQERRMDSSEILCKCDIIRDKELLLNGKYWT